MGKTKFTKVKPGQQGYRRIGVGAKFRPNNGVGREIMSPAEYIRLCEEKKILSGLGVKVKE